ncbi:hypothetical protein [Snodgrassella sp. ESL0253]|uniref:hypothetical protein n=1 Tax=Snodgrassella sp. ESL0253 TaxID=2705031 RepID=UPI001583E374|nr:hypothetical protein [Snodgrassella sp. ESL0253]NUE67488.1 hypothetical protein [Snodgrassella sp. ESL0253]
MMENKMKFLAMASFIALCGCGTNIPAYQKQLEANGYTSSKVIVYPANEKYAQIPAQYLVDERGRYIDENGNLTDHPVENPYYRDYMKHHR